MRDRCLHIIVMILLMVLGVWSAQAAGIKEKVYGQYMQEIPEVLREEINNPKKIQKAVKDITENGDVYQRTWLGFTLSRIDCSTIDDSTIPVYREWSQALILQLMAEEPDLAALADGRLPLFLSDPYFYSIYMPYARLMECLSLLYDVCNVVNSKQEGIVNAAMEPVYQDMIRVKSHYIEYTLYGNDRYANRVYGVAVDSLSLRSLATTMGSDLFITSPYLFLSIFAEVPEWRQTNILDNEELLLVYSMHYLSTVDQNMCSSALTQMSYAHGRSREDSKIRMSVIARLFPSSQALRGGTMSTIEADNVEHVQLIADFIAYQQQLRTAGKEFVEYPPALCPEELRDDAEYVRYSEMYARTGYAICKELGKFNAVSYINNNGNAVREMVKIMGFTDPQEEWLDRVGLYVSNLAGTTLDIYYNSHASWTIGALVTEAKILTDLLEICTIDAIYYTLMQLIPFFSGEMGNDDYARYIMDNYLFPFMPYVKLQTKDKELNCFYMDFYTKIIQFMVLYEEPRRSELEKFYVPRFEQAVKKNTYCPWRYEHVAALADYYFHKEDSLKTFQYMRENLSLTQDTTYYHLFEYLVYAGVANDYQRAAAALDAMNRTDSATAANYVEFSGLNPAYVYAKAGEKAKAIQQLNVFNTFLRQQFSIQLMTVGGTQASELLKRYEGVNDYFVQSQEEMEDPELKAGFVRELYNWQLFSKGLLLALNRESEAILKNHPSQTVRGLYDQLTRLETQLSMMTNRDNFEAQMLQTNIDEVRNNLMLTIRDHIDENASANVHMTNWQDVRNALQANETAIEIVCAKQEDDSVNSYYALLLHQGDTAPQAIRLFKEPELTRFIGSQDAASIHAMYEYTQHGKALSELIWGHVQPYLHEGERIYFSPTSVLHQIAMESLPYDAQRSMSDVYDMVRVSSTREVARTKPVIAHRKAALYGGIVYDATPDELYAESSRYPQLAMRSMDSDTIDRGKVRYLPGTKTEIEQIRKALTEQQIEVESYSSIAANEESFKALSGSGQNILHLATHGFYWPYESLNGQKHIDQYSVQYLNDPLNRCGLLFAGSNTALGGHSDRLQKNVQDGILTAREISLLDFSEADIVVLSACETGLGDVTSEGVFGLQRAFKMAGSQTMLMALWKVNDEATRILMTAFYRNMSKGMSKREAFRNAQLEVKNYTAASESDEDRGTMHDKFMQKSGVGKRVESGESRVESEKQHPFASPYYWAGFVMLD